MLTPENPARQWWLLTAPRLTRAALMAATLVFVLAMQDVNVTILLAAPGQETLAIRALTLLHYAPDNLVAALCLVTLAAITFGLAALWGLDHLARFTLRKATPHCALD